MKKQDQIKSSYDIVVIGGGVQGSGIALLASAAGYSVLQVEKNQWASGTSSKSSKLIHGGLRYLQTGQFKLVYECLTERRWMLNKMPNLVTANWFYIPIYKSSRYSPWKIRLGLCLYRLLSGRTPHSQYKSIPKSEWPALAGINQKNLQAVFAYQDAQTDDAELTREVVKNAQTLGADCVENTWCSAGQRLENGDHSLLLIQGDQEYSVTCHTVVNATGPWVNQTLNLLDQKHESLAVDLVQGSHLIVSPQLSEQCFYMEAPQDGRAIFCLPWKGKTLVGTTEHLYQGEPSQAVLTEEEKNYLLDVVHHYFPNYDCKIDDHFCGLRVLPKSDKKAFLRTRDTIIHSSVESGNRIISLYGGKLTAWRATAYKVLGIIDKGFGRHSSIDIDELF